MFTAATIVCLGLAQQGEAGGFDTPGWSVSPGVKSLAINIIPPYDYGSEFYINLGGLKGGGFPGDLSVPFGSVDCFYDVISNSEGDRGMNAVFSYGFVDIIDGVRISSSYSGPVFNYEGLGFEGLCNRDLGRCVSSLNRDAAFQAGVWSLGPLVSGVYSSIIFTVEEVVDADGDGVPDDQDAFPNDPTETADADGDGCGDNADPYPNSLSVEEVPFIFVGNVAIDNADVDDCTTLADLIDDVLSRDLGAEEMVVYLQEWRDAGYITGREMGQIIKENNTN